MNELVTRPHRQALVRWGASHPEALVLSADLSASCEADGFREAYPERFLSLGMAEQNLMSFAGGLAREGFIPLVHTFAVFVTRRPFDQVAMSIAYPNLPVRLLGFLPGISTPGGVTHQAIDDLALMRALPNMTIIECGDATEVESLLPAIATVDGPVYARVMRGAVPRLFPQGRPLVLGQPRQLSTGRDLCVISCGAGTHEALPAVAALEQQGVGVSHLHLATLWPLAREPLLAAIEAARYGVISVENHLSHGGLGSAIAELMADYGLGQRLRRIGLDGTYAHGASQSALMRHYGLDATAILGRASELLGRPLVETIANAKGAASNPATERARQSKAEDL